MRSMRSMWSMRSMRSRTVPFREFRELDSDLAGDLEARAQGPFNAS